MTSPILMPVYYTIMSSRRQFVQTLGFSLPAFLKSPVKQEPVQQLVEAPQSFPKEVKVLSNVLEFNTLKITYMS